MKRLIAAAAVAAVLVPVALARPGATTSLTANLTGGAEVPKGSPLGKGTSTITITGGRVCWKSTFSGIDKPTASHIHKGGVGVAGPVVVPLGPAFKPSGCTTAPAAVTKAIVAHPSLYYVNIHTAKFPAGAIRGQLAAGATLTGTVGPGFTISLEQGGKPVTTLKPGAYTFVIHDQASIHSFSLDGPNGFEKAFTTVPFVGSKTVKVTLEAGAYKFYCVPHEATMFGRFTVK
jgi:CHRD domain